MEELGLHPQRKLTIYKPRRAANPALPQPERTHRPECCCYHPHPAE